MKTDHFYIKDSPYFYGGELVQISSFNKEDLKIDKKRWKDLTIYYNNYVNRQLCLSINNKSGYISEENDEEFLTINKKNFVSILSTLNDLIDIKEGKSINFNDGSKKIKFLSDSDLVLNKLLYFTELIIMIRCVLELEDLFYAKVYLGYGRYQL